MFESMIAHLGQVKLLKQEDIGTYYFSDIDGSTKPPDFRVVTNTEEQLLIEVKNVAPKNGEKIQRIRAVDIDEERRYAKMTGARLLIAHYWSAMNLWSLVDSSVLEPDGKYLALSFETALLANELAALGDHFISIPPPVSVRFIADLNLPERQRETAWDREFRLADWRMS